VATLVADGAGQAGGGQVNAVAYWDCSHYVRGALMKHNTSGSAASMMHVT
jgi:hypothetical protein